MKEIFFFELRYRARQPSTYLFFFLLFALSLLIFSSDSMETNSAGGRIKYNAPYLLISMGLLFTLFGGLIVSAIMGTAIYRDFETNTHELFFTTHLSKRGYFFGRFLGAFTVTALVFLGIPLGIYVGTIAPWAHAINYGPFRADVYLTLIGIFLLPNLFLTGSLFFVLGAVTRNLLSIYIQGLILFGGYTVALVLINQLESTLLASLLDPFGFTPMTYQTRYWTQFERNISVPTFTGDLATNRIIWFALASLVLAGGYRIFTFASHGITLPNISLHKRSNRSLAEDTRPNLSLAITSLSAPAPGNLAHILSSYLRLTLLYFREIVFSVPFCIVTILGTGLFLITASSAEKILDISVLPVTRVMLESVSGAIEAILIILLTFYAGEMTWRERVVRVDQISDTLPLPTILSPLSKASALMLMAFALEVFLVLLALGIQVISGYYRFELGLYVLFLTTNVLPGLLQITFTAFFIQALVNQKFVGHILTIGLYLSALILTSLKWERHLFIFLSEPEATYSDMNGFGPYLEVRFWYALYWLGITMALFFIGSRVWVRGREERLKARWKSGGNRIITALFVAMVVTAAGSGAFIYYNTDILNTFRSANRMNDWREDYERQYRADWEKRPMPRITSVSLDVDLRPETRQYTVAGTYHLKNKTKAPIPEIAVVVDPDLVIRQFTFSVPATPQIVHRELGFRTYRFASPLQPGQEITLSFILNQPNRGFRNANIETEIAGNGTFLTMPGPSIGYQKSYEISDENDRREHNLPPQEEVAPVTDRFALQNVYVSNDADRVDFEAIVRTAPDQIAIAPGYLQREWRESGRRCFHYKMDQPIWNFYSILSARYAVARDTWKSPDGRKVALEIYYHPPHTMNIRRMLDGMKAALTYCSKNFSPYQFRQLRIAEFPVYQTFAQSFPNTIPYSEGLGFIAKITDDKRGVDYPFYVTAHETAHQWWAHQLLGADVEGATLLSESLAEYSASQVLQERYGWNYCKRLLSYNQEAYLKGRGKEHREERPLVKVGNQPYLHYNKGALAFNALAERIGDDVLNAALSRFLRDNAHREAPYPTAPELLRYLRDAAGPGESAFITNMFEKITIWDCRTTKAKATRLKSGKWRVTVTVYATQYYADGSGKETEARVNDTFEISIHTHSPKDKNSNEGSSLVRRWQSLSQPYTNLTFDVDSEPVGVWIDPYRTLIERDTYDNYLVIDSSKPVK